MNGSLSRIARRARPVVLGWFVFQATVAIAGRLTARRKDEGDETSLALRRTVTHAGLELRPVNPGLSRVRIDLAMAGAELDLTALPRPEHGVDVTLRVLMGGVAVRVPADWRVWWRSLGAGGVGGDGSVARVHDERSADVRIHAVVVLGGVGVEGS
jgi:hypothetical protein